MAVDWCVCWCLSEFLVKSCVQEDWRIALVLVESYESRCEKHAACLNWDAGWLRGGFSSEAPATKWKLTKSCLLLRFQPPWQSSRGFYSSFHQIPSAPTLTDWADFSSLPPGNIQTCTNCPSRSDYSIIQLFFFSSGVYSRTCGPLQGHY